MPVIVFQHTGVSVGTFFAAKAIFYDCNVFIMQPVYKLHTWLLHVHVGVADVHLWWSIQILIVSLCRNQCLVVFIQVTPT